MPSRYTVREYDVPAYYHVYNRGFDGKHIFSDAQDKYKFLSILERYLSDDVKHREYPTYPIELVAYCVMGNHFHLFLFQDSNPTAITNLMRSVATSYSMYYNLKYKHHSHVFQSVFKASRIINEAHFQHISRYIHLNPETYLSYKWSSLPYFTGKPAPDWVHPERVLDMSPHQYIDFLHDYTDKRELYKEIKDELAH